MSSQPETITGQDIGALPTDSLSTDLPVPSLLLSWPSGRVSCNHAYQAAGDVCNVASVPGCSGQQLAEAQSDHVELSLEPEIGFLMTFRHRSVT